MFCEKCGSQIPDDANFCEKCGAKINNININTPIDDTTSVKNDEPIFVVKSTYKFIYAALPPLIMLTIYFIPFLALASWAIVETTKNISSNPFIDLWPITLVVFGLPFFVILCYIIGYFIQRKQYQNYSYTFYKDKVIFKDNFVNISERTLKYKNIREVLKRQTWIQRIFNIGNIHFFSSAEAGDASGISMRYIENVNEVYNKIQEIINV